MNPRVHLRLHLAAAILGIAAMTTLLLPFRSSLGIAAVALTYVLIVIGAAVYLGSKAALGASVLASLCLNFFFIPPYNTLQIGSAENWISFAAFLITAISVGQLSARARERAAEAESRRKEAESLYARLQDAIQQASDREALRKSEQVKSALLDAVTHDLRSPLTSIKAAATSLLRAADADSKLDKNREFMEVIVEESDRLNEFIEGMVEVARLEGGAKLSQTPVHLRDIIDVALQRAEHRLKRHRIEVDVPSELQPVNVDPSAIAEVIFSLVDNAAKYSPHYSLIRLSATAKNGSEIVTVEDEGSGIPASMREQVFDKFFRAETKHGKPGFGMGLTIARTIVEAHGGTIAIDGRRNGRGVAISFTLPVAAHE